MTQMTCRVRAITPGLTSWIPLPQGMLLRMQIPFARRRAADYARRATIENPKAIFFVETEADDGSWINKDIWYQGHQYEIVGERIPNLPFVSQHKHLIRA